MGGGQPAWVRILLDSGKNGFGDRTRSGGSKNKVKVKAGVGEAGVEEDM